MMLRRAIHELRKWMLNCAFTNGNVRRLQDSISKQDPAEDPTQLILQAMYYGKPDDGMVLMMCLGCL